LVSQFIAGDDTDPVSGREARHYAQDAAAVFLAPLFAPGAAVRQMKVKALGTSAFLAQPAVSKTAK
jgi:hypothetical protein